jgi:UDP-sugar transporter A1/2/3
MSSQGSAALDSKAIFYMCLLAVQFGMQPTLTRRYTPEGICRSTVILAQEILKFALAYAMLNISGSKKSALAGTEP